MSSKAPVVADLAYIIAVQNVTALTNMPKALHTIIGQSFFSFRVAYNTHMAQLSAVAKGSNGEPVWPDRFSRI